MSAGDIFWAKHGRIWYPAQVCTQNEIPDYVLQKLTKNIQGKVFVKWWWGDVSLQKFAFLIALLDSS